MRREERHQRLTRPHFLILSTVNETHRFIPLLGLLLALFIFFLTGDYLGLWTSSLAVYINADELKL